MEMYLGFFAFKHKPDVEKLNKIDWLDAWRLFEEPALKAWHLEGQSKTNGPTFHEEIHIRNAPTSSEIERLLPIFEQRLDELKLTDASEKKRHVKEWLNTPLLLSEALGQEVMEIYGNDAGDDQAFLCDRGKFVRASFMIEYGVATLEGDDATLDIVRFYEEGAGPDQGRVFDAHEVAAAEMTLLFGSVEPWPLTSDPFDLKARAFRLVAQKGEALVPSRTPGELARDNIDAALGAPLADKKFEARTFLNYIRSDLTKALSPSLITAELNAVDQYERVISAYARYATDCAEFGSVESRKRAKHIADFLWDVCGSYLRGLRPRPQFRKSSYNYPAYNRELKRRWLAMRFQFLVF